MTNKFEYLELKEESDIIEYQKGLYKAFVERDYDKWLAKHYNIEDKKLIPCYDNIIIYSVKEYGKIIGAVAINYDCLKKMQFQHLGFKVGSDCIDKKVCECINMFIDENVVGEKFMNAFIPFFDYIMNKLKEQNFNIMYLTCDKRLKSMLLYSGFDLVDTKKIDDKTEFFFKIDI